MMIWPKSIIKCHKLQKPQASYFIRFAMPDGYSEMREQETAAAAATALPLSTTAKHLKLLVPAEAFALVMKFVVHDRHYVQLSCSCAPWWEQQLVGASAHLAEAYLGVSFLRWEPPFKWWEPPEVRAP
jgi:hypothetical protein